PEGGGPGEVSANDQGIDEKPDQLFVFGPRAPCNGTADHEILLAGIAIEKGEKGGQSGHKWRRTFLLAEPIQAVGKAAGNDDALCSAPGRLYRWTRPIGRNGSRIRGVGELLNPVGASLL